MQRHQADLVFQKSTQEAEGSSRLSTEPLEFQRRGPAGPQGLLPSFLAQVSPPAWAKVDTGLPVQRLVGIQPYRWALSRACRVAPEGPRSWGKGVNLSPGPLDVSSGRPKTDRPRADK